MLLVLWIVQVVRRRTDTRRYVHERVVPVRERFTPVGDLAFWLSLILAASLCIVALARRIARLDNVSEAVSDVTFARLSDPLSPMVQPETGMASSSSSRTNTGGFAGGAR